MYKSDYLAISIGAFSEINRQLYYDLAAMDKKVVLVFPEELAFTGGIRRYEKVERPDLITAIPMLTQFENPRLTLYKGLKAVIAEHRPKYIYTEYDPASLLGVVLGIWSKKYKFKLMCNSCENLELDMVSVYKREGWRGVAPCIMKNLFILLGKKNIYHVFALGLDGQRIFKNLGFKSVSIIHLGFEEKLFTINNEKREEIRNQLGIVKNVIGYFGRQVPEKGVHILIQALDKLKHLDWTFLMDEFARYKTPYQENVANMLVEYGIKDRVIFFDAPHNEVAWYMNAADIIVVHSITSKKWKEQFGRVAPESMACGCAVLVSDSGTLKELVPDESFIVPEQNVEALTNAIEQLLLNPELRVEMGMKAHIHAHKLYTMKMQAKRIAEIV